MELTTQQAEAVERQTNLRAIPDENESFTKLQEVFGDHTFFANEQGLFVFQNIEDGADSQARMRLFAAWSESDQNTLVKLDEPVDANIVLDLSSLELFQTPGAEGEA